MVNKVYEFPFDMEIIPPLWGGLNQENTFLIFIDSIIAILTSGKFVLTSTMRTFLKAIDEADIVIHSPGGPCIGDIYGRNTIEWRYLYQLFLVERLKKPIFFYAPSLGPFKNRFRNIFRKIILNRTTAITVRDTLSYNYLNKIGIKAYLSADSALQDGIPDIRYVTQNFQGKEINELLDMLKKEIIIAVIISDLRWHPNFSDSSELRNKINNTFLEVLKYLINKGYSILLIPQLFGEQNDFNLLKKFQKVNKDKIKILSQKIDSKAQQSIISRVFCIISVRYHPIIFAIKSKVPFIAIYYEHKQKALIDTLGLEEFALPVQEINAIEVIKRFELLENKYEEIVEKIKKAEPQLKEQSMQSIKQLKKILNLE